VEKRIPSNLHHHEGQTFPIDEDGLLRPAFIKSGESNSEAEKESALDQPAGEIPF
jgi:hypothetical protein